MGTSGTYQPVRKTEETISDVSQQDVCIIEGYMLKIGTHDSATGEKAMSWWMKLLTPFGRHRARQSENSMRQAVVCLTSESRR